jgi:S-DNA-T family DNA segregation ATPase FtsK/SpoIIIE
MNTFNETTKAELANNYQLPPIDLLNDYVPDGSAVTEEELTIKKDAIAKVLNDNNMLFGKIIATVGPTVTLFEIVPEKVNIMKLDKMGKDFAANLNVEGVRIVAPIWERGTIGIEVPNAQPQKVSLRSLIASEQFQKSDAKIPVVLGQTIDNEAYILDLKSRLLIVGDDEKGKAAALNTIITSLLYKNNPSQVKFVMIDPNGKDLMLYQSLPKMFFAQQLNVDDNVITDYDKIIDTLESLRIEMKRRETLIRNMGCYSNIDNYNKLVATGLLNPAVGHKHLPYIVVVINNFDELIRAQRQAIEQKMKGLDISYMSGIIWIITTTISCDRHVFTAAKRIYFRVNEKIISARSRGLADECKLNGNGDALIRSHGEYDKTIRLQCADIEDAEIERIVNFIGSQPCDEYKFVHIGVDVADKSSRDPLFNEAAHIVVKNQQGSTSLIQKELSISPQRADLIMDQLEAAYIVDSFQGSKPRFVHIPTELALNYLFESLNSGNK